MLSIADRAWIKLRGVYLRITLTRYTAAFFLFCFLQCFAQGFIQSYLYSIDYDASSLVSSILEQAQVPYKDEFAWLERDHSAYKLQLCQHIPGGATAEPCITAYETGHDNPPNFTGYRKRDEPAVAVNAQPTGKRNQGLFVAATHDSSGNIDGVTLTAPNSTTVQLSLQCTRVLIYPDQVLKNSRREELALIGSQFWLFVISFYAILYDSIPHLYAAVFTRMIQSGWSAYSVWRTHDIKQRFENLVIKPETPCHTDLLFPGYFHDRLVWQIPDLVLNLLALITTAYLGWKLARLYSQNVFKCVGPPKHIVRIYRLFLAIFVNMQLSVFFLVSLMGLWIDQLFNSAIATISSHTAIYTVLFIVTMVCLLPWITLGWHAVRREMRRMMLLFLAANLTFIVGWAAMFDSLVFRWTFVQWPYLGCMTVASFVFLTASLVLGVLCYRKFGEGLAQYLHVEGMLSDNDFEPEVFGTDAEKGGMRKGSDAGFPSDPITVILDMPPPAYVLTRAYDECPNFNVKQ